MKLINIIKEVNWKSLIIGSAICVFLAAFGVQEKMDILVLFHQLDYYILDMKVQI